MADDWTPKIPPATEPPPTPPLPSGVMPAWEREYLESDDYQRNSDAACLRDAAAILRNRARKQTFLLRVFTGVLERRADRISRG